MGGTHGFVDLLAGDVNYPEVMEALYEIGYEDYVYGECVTLIEWANLIEDILPDHRICITIEKDLEQGFEYRKITIEERTA